MTWNGTRWVARQLAQVNENLTTFGEDEDGEIYVGAQGSDAVSLITGPAEPQVSASGVVDAARFAEGIVAGSAASVFAVGSVNAPGVVAAEATPLPGSISNVSVALNGITAPLYAVANVQGVEQVNFQVPWELASAATAQLVVTRDGVSSAAVTVPLRAAQPGIFTTDGQNAIAVHNADNTLVTSERPAVTGETIYVYATGLGPVSNQPATGAAGPLSPLARTPDLPVVTLNGMTCLVQFSGLAPGFVGIYQVNVRVPGALPHGPVDLVVSMGGAASPAVKVRVQ